MAVNCQFRSLATALRKVTVPASSMVKRRSSAPAAVVIGVPALGSVRPPVVTMSRWICPVARTTSVLPAGTVTAPGAVGTGSPGRKPASTTGALPV